MDGHGQIFGGFSYGGLIGAVDVLGPASLTSLCNAMRRTRSSYVQFIDQTPAKVAQAHEMYGPETVSLYISEFGDDGVDIFVEKYVDPADPEPDTDQLERVIEPLLARHRATGSIGIDDDHADWGGLHQLGTWITFPHRGRIVYDAYRLGKDVLTLLEAAHEGGELRHETALDVLRGGRADLLIGQRETDWIDFKREAYTKDDHSKLELAKDVAAFANADGGLLVLGISAPPSGHYETASKILPIPAGTVKPQSYRAVIARRIHPPPTGVDVFSVPQQGGDVWVIAVPPQPEEMKPFLVHGAVIDRKVNDAYFSIVSRRADEIIPTDPQAVHALLAAGRAALRPLAKPKSRARKRP